VGVHLIQRKVIQNTGLALAWYDNEAVEHVRTKKGMFYDFEQTPEVDRIIVSMSPETGAST
jgi:membrane carboxypeptidase/penicillin-binding protein